VRVRLGEPVPLFADVTPGAVDQLGLRPGAPVWVAVKATAIDVALH
jgi:molybdopterin-binding protein